MTSGAQDLECSFDTREDHELYLQLMQERQRLQQRCEDKRRQKKPVVRKRHSVASPAKLDERERGFQLYVSGANEERAELASRHNKVLQFPRKPSAGARRGCVGGGYGGRTGPNGDGNDYVPCPGEAKHGARQWQIETVELRAEDGSAFRVSPNLAASSSFGAPETKVEVNETTYDEVGDEEIGEDLIQTVSSGPAAVTRQEFFSRPTSSASSNPGGLDSDTRGLLRVMNEGDAGQLSMLRDTLKMRLSMPSVSSVSRPSTSEQSFDGGGRPTSSASSVIANAIQAENELVRLRSRGEPNKADASSSQQQAVGGSRVSGSRSLSKPRTRLPLSAEAAANFAPPSALRSGSGLLGNLGDGSGSACSSMLPGRMRPASPASLKPTAAWEGVPVTSSAHAAAAPSACGGRHGARGSGVRIDVARDARHSLSHVAVSSSRKSGVAQSASLSPEELADELRERVGRLDRKNQKALLRMLAELDGGASPEVVGRNGGSLGHCGGGGISDSGDRKHAGLDLEMLDASGRGGSGGGRRAVGETDGGSKSKTACITPPRARPQAKERDVPIWLTGSPLPVRGDLSDESQSPQRAQHATIEEDDELKRSMRALENFRSSQSRLFFGDNLDDLCKDARPQEVASRRRADRLRSDSPQATLAPCQTAVFDGACSSESPGQISTEIHFEGSAIPIMDFGEHDALDDFLEEARPSTAMGSSLLASDLGSMCCLVIPTVPRGRVLVFNCVTTWGDENFVGLAGIEIFDGRGFPVILKDVHRQVTADPHSINVLPEYKLDPRTPDKLFDQVNLTRDDLHVWLAPFRVGRVHSITVDLEHTMGISMIRIWNYNKSRLHSSRGVKDLEILFDGRAVFAGEIRKAPGLLTCPEQACEHILFTQDEAVLRAMEERDWLPAQMPLSSDDEDGTTAGDGSGTVLSIGPTGATRPSTADLVPEREGADGRPITCPTDRHHAHATTCRSVTLVLHSTWGDNFYVGLTGLEVLDESLKPLPAGDWVLDASPRDLNDLDGVEGDHRTIDKLQDGVTCTTDDTHMWMAPLHKVTALAEKAAARMGEEACLPRNLLRLEFSRPREIAGFNIWNYNKSAEDTCRGLKEFSVYCDERYVATFMCRKAPGHVRFDFKQVVLMDQPPSAESGGGLLRGVGVPSVAPRLPRRSPGIEGGCGKLADDGIGEVSPTSSVGSAGALSGGAFGETIAAVAPEEDIPRRRRRLSDGPPGVVSEARAERVQQQCETPLHPCGFIIKLVLLSTWSDVHYIGLDGLELYDLEGRPLRPRRAFSSHGSVCDLPGMSADVRKETNLLEGSPGSSGRMWLAPRSTQQSAHNAVELVFEEQTRISCLHVWNYTRTPSRGVRDVEIYVDDILVYQGILRKGEEKVNLGVAPRQSSSRLPPPGGEAILFTTLPNIVERHRPFVFLPCLEETVDFSFFDQDGYVDPAGRSTVSKLSGAHRPMTSLTCMP
eukprot:TRINITY_DN73654_c0_g1_i1.p1 TRINITY_DN73654_c0_g1~~TRINITY_DN73654_c0_g1_i1.p1  ORF type:complete len:1461 (+),score=257.73 TRINITY_DN73654_c0_g1_i1:63-4445(+)